MTSPSAGRSGPRCLSAPMARQQCRRCLSINAISADPTILPRSMRLAGLTRSSRPEGERRMMRTAIIQTTTGIEPADNARDLEVALAHAAREGAVFAFTPEMCGMLDTNRTRIMAKAAFEADDPVLATIREAAARHRSEEHTSELQSLMRISYAG